MFGKRASIYSGCVQAMLPRAIQSLYGCRAWRPYRMTEYVQCPLTVSCHACSAPPLYPTVSCMSPFVSLLLRCLTSRSQGAGVVLAFRYPASFVAVHPKFPGTDDQSVPAGHKFVSVSGSVACLKCYQSITACNPVFPSVLSPWIATTVPRLLALHAYR